jgi:hypothetical protein
MPDKDKKIDVQIVARTVNRLIVLPKFRLRLKSVSPDIFGSSIVVMESGINQSISDSISAKENIPLCAVPQKD